LYKNLKAKKTVISCIPVNEESTCAVSRL